jgi:hypothetical protein
LSAAGGPCQCAWKGGLIVALRGASERIVAVCPSDREMGEPAEVECGHRSLFALHHRVPHGPGTRSRGRSTRSLPVLRTRLPGTFEATGCVAQQRCERSGVLPYVRRDPAGRLATGASGKASGHGASRTAARRWILSSWVTASDHAVPLAAVDAGPAGGARISGVVLHTSRPVVTW